MRKNIKLYLKKLFLLEEISLILKEFCKDLDIIQGPALRFNDLFNSSFHIKKLYTIVLFLEGASKKMIKT